MAAVELHLWCWTGSLLVTQCESVFSFRFVRWFGSRRHSSSVSRKESKRVGRIGGGGYTFLRLVSHKHIESIISIS